MEGHLNRPQGPGTDWPVGRYEQMPCLSRPAPTSSLGHLEEGVPGQMAEVEAEVYLALGPPIQSDWGERGEGAPSQPLLCIVSANNGANKEPLFLT